MVCFKLLYMDNLWLVGDKGKKLHRTSAEQLRKKKKKDTSGLEGDLEVKLWQIYMRWSLEEWREIKKWGEAVPFLTSSKHNGTEKSHNKFESLQLLLLHGK